jgi:hypothetical protein
MDPELQLDQVTVDDFQFDKGNLPHLAAKGIDENLVWEVRLTDDVRVFEDKREGHRAATHKMIGPDSMGRLWTIAMVLVDDELALWRPITGWPSKRKEGDAWRDAG